MGWYSTGPKIRPADLGEIVIHASIMIAHAFVRMGEGGSKVCCSRWELVCCTCVWLLGARDHLDACLVYLPPAVFCFCLLCVCLRHFAEINELVRKYTSNPILCIIDVNPRDELEIPTEAYISVESAPEVGVTRDELASGGEWGGVGGRATSSSPCPPFSFSLFLSVCPLATVFVCMFVFELGCDLSYLSPSRHRRRRAQVDGRSFTCPSRLVRTRRRKSVSNTCCEEYGYAKTIYVHAHTHAHACSLT